MKLKELFEAEERSILSVLGKLPNVMMRITGSSNIGLTSLEGSPIKITGNFYCYGNHLDTLKFAPRHIGGDFWCFKNWLTSLDGAPLFVGGEIDCSHNKLTSLKGIHKQIKYIGGPADFSDNPIKSHVLGLLKIDKLQSVRLDDIEVEKIINKHIKGDRDIFACQEELIEAGYPEFAQL
jgi:hypothetical protein